MCVMPVIGANAADSPATVDCKELIKLTEVFTIRVHSDTPEFTGALPEKLSRTACKVTYAAWKSGGQKKAWLNGLLFSVTKTIDGSDFQAAMGGVVSRKVTITTAMLEKSKEEHLLWILAHELGHGVLNHRLKKLGTRIAGVGVAAAGIVAFVKGKPKVAIGLATAGMAAVVCGPGVLSLSQEVDADLYSLKLLNAGLGIPLPNSKLIAVSALLLTGNSAAETCRPSKDNLHPATSDRVKAMKDYSP